jgi:hypothetical protein
MDVISEYVSVIEQNDLKKLIEDKNAKGVDIQAKVKEFVSKPDKFDTSPILMSCFLKNEELEQKSMRFECI